MTPEELLRQLLTHFIIRHNDRIEWSYIEGTAIRDVDTKGLESQLLPYMEK